MLPLFYIICWFFYDKLRGIDSRGNFEHLWACLYSVAIFVALLLHPSIQMFFYLGKPFYSSSSETIHNVSTYIDLPFPLILLISILLGILFYYTVRLPAYMTGGRMFGLLIAIPGVFINGIVAYVLVNILS